MATKPFRFSVLTVLTLTIILLTITVVNADLGTGWTVQYFNNANLEGSPVVTETLPGGVQYNWGTGSPNALVPADNFSARFISVQQLIGGIYQFHLASDDGARMYIDDVLVLDRWGGRPFTQDTFQQSLTAGAHSFRIEYMELVDQAMIQFEYILVSAAEGQPTPIPGSGTGFVPTPFGTPVVPVATVYSGPLATVVGVRGLALRTGPYLGASMITTLEGGASYPLLGRNTDEGIYGWYLLQVGERTGWASGRYLQLNIDPNVVTRQTSIFDSIDGTQGIGAVAIPRAVMNVRSRPSTRMPIVASIPWGQPVELIGRTVQAGMDRWYQVRFNGVVGWIDARWVTVRGERYNIAIR